MMKATERYKLNRKKYDKETQLVYGICSESNIFGNLQIKIGIDHEDAALKENGFNKEYILKQVGKALDEWGWL